MSQRFKTHKQIKYVNALLRALLHFADYKAQLSTSALAPIHIPAVHLSEAWEKTLALVHVSVKHALSERKGASSPSAHRLRAPGAPNNVLSK